MIPIIFFQGWERSEPRLKRRKDRLSENVQDGGWWKKARDQSCRLKQNAWIGWPILVADFHLCWCATSDQSVYEDCWWWQWGAAERRLNLEGVPLSGCGYDRSSSWNMDPGYVVGKQCYQTLGYARGDTLIQHSLQQMCTPNLIIPSVIVEESDNSALALRRLETVTDELREPHAFIECWATFAGARRSWAEKIVFFKPPWWMVCDHALEKLDNGRGWGDKSVAAYVHQIYHILWEGHSSCGVPDLWANGLYPPVIELNLNHNDDNAGMLLSLMRSLAKWCGLKVLSTKEKSANWIRTLAMGLFVWRKVLCSRAKIESSMLLFSLHAHWKRSYIPIVRQNKYCSTIFSRHIIPTEVIAIGLQSDKSEGELLFRNRTECRSSPCIWINAVFQGPCRQCGKHLTKLHTFTNLPHATSGPADFFYIDLSQYFSDFLLIYCRFMMWWMTRCPINLFWYVQVVVRFFIFTEEIT